MTKMLKRVLQDVLSEEESEQLISAFDQIGDIIIVRIPDSLVSKKEIIGRTLLEQVNTANSIFYQSSPVKGDFRTRQLEVIAGEDKTQTEYKENGCRFIVDVEKAFFSPRLSTERERIAGLVKEDEVVINMFGGVGMFSILAAKETVCTVYNIDINPVAAQLCKENAQINKLKGAVISLNGDATQIINEQLAGKAERVLMLLPERSDEFLDSALNGLKDKGIIHYYSHMHADRNKMHQNFLKNIFCLSIKQTQRLSHHETLDQ